MIRSPQIRIFIEKLYNSSFIRFCIVGTTGLLVDILVLYILLAWTNLNPFEARVLSIWAAMSNNWFLNRVFTFQSTRHSTRWRHITSQYLRFVMVNTLGACINYAAYSLLLISFVQLPPTLAVAIATFASLAFNYLGSKAFAFRSN
ncbi:GtrA family protein [Polycladidibacter stylochi]|uniref:GtrA family protein n=1 Tax=Polycladidibacter stylochi TaxID=1807766 RepID=UPI00082E90B6|nr:GtrA family protein [Pseudovibrio stylochi]